MNWEDINYIITTTLILCNLFTDFRVAAYHGDLFASVLSREIIALKVKRRG